ncbi:hypothetical protein V1478_000971 [Vespula squamosa]|uniref:Uncharacterized protein n=1 Tax=Vespula squamosa TaxID=30214 RepID=A0ABD2C7L9_VESSQ
MKKKSKPYRTKEVYDQDCSIIYCNKFEDEEQLPEYVCPSEAPKTQEDHDWTGSDISVCTFPITEKQIGKECLESKRANERKCDQRDDAKSKDPFADIPSIQSYDLPDPVERKPEPEVLATVLLSSEKDDLREVKPSVIFDKLFLDATSHQNFTIDTKKESARTNNIDDLPLDTIQIVSFAEEPMDYGDMEDYNQKKWTKDEMLKYMMKPEATTAYKNYVRLNGSVKPSWFPGYVLVSPLIPDCIRITSDPGEGLLEAWRLCRPRHFDEFSKSFLNTA